MKRKEEEDNRDIKAQREMITGLLGAKQESTVSAQELPGYQREKRDKKKKLRSLSNSSQHSS